MQLWLSKNSEVPVRDQLTAQIVVGIASGDLTVGEKLPSTRELARRFGIHQNTVSAAYRRLATQGFVEFRQGSGVYICETLPVHEKPSIDALIGRFLDEARALGYSREDITEKLLQQGNGDGFSGFLVVEPNHALCEIIIEEISSATGQTVSGISIDEIDRTALDGFQITAMFDEEEKLGPILPVGTNCIYLKANSVAATLSGRTRPSANDLIGIASGWDDFLTFARLFLLAAKIDPETIIICSTCESGWKRSMKSSTAIICDSFTAKELPGDSRVNVFRLIAESSLLELRSRISSRRTV